MTEPEIQEDEMTQLSPLEEYMQAMQQVEKEAEAAAKKCSIEGCSAKSPRCSAHKILRIAKLRLYGEHYL